jgi:hypothetical protein
MKEITLTQGKVALVDDEDYERLSKFKYYPLKDKHGQIYAIRKVKTGHRWGGRWRYTTIRMHHDVVGKAPLGLVPDHIDRNGLNNTKNNLRFVTQSVNVLNSDRVDRARTRSHKETTLWTGVNIWTEIQSPTPKSKKP